AAGSVQDQHCVADLAARIRLWRAQRVVVQLDFGQALARLELKILDDKGAVCRRRIIGAPGSGSSDDCKHYDSKAGFHERSPVCVRRLMTGQGDVKTVAGCLNQSRL